MQCRRALLVSLGSIALVLDCAQALAQRPAAAYADSSAEALTVEAHRPKIIERLVEAHGDALRAHGIPLDAFRAALWELPSDRLLAASLADGAEEVNTIVALALAGVHAKDGPGSGANSWIGYTGGGNVASGMSSAVAAGTGNVASGQKSFVGAGSFNAATGQGSFVGGGTSNVAGFTSALVMGGFDNRATVIDALVVAGAGNRATGARSVVVGGGYNLASGQWSFVGGGGRQTGSGVAGTSGEDNVASGDFAVVVGGRGNRATGETAVVMGGAQNVASGLSSTVGGGGLFNFDCLENGAQRPCANLASNNGATASGGYSNNATGVYATVGGGYFNTASGGVSTVPGGEGNTALGTASFAAGRHALANYDYCFVWGDGTTTNPVSCDAPNRWVVRAEGGVFFFAGNDGTNAQGHYTGVVLPPGAQAWIAASDRDGKDDVRPVDAKQVLRRIATLPISTWRWKSQDAAIRHMGPMAQDFRAAFGLGETPRGISTIDADGVALAAIQGLNQKLDETRRALRAKEARIERLERELRAIMAKLALD